MTAGSRTTGTPEGAYSVGFGWVYSEAAGFRQSARGYLKAAESADREPHVRKRMQVIRMNIRLKPEDIPVLMEMIEAVVKFADEHKSADGERLAWSSILYPPVR